MRATRYAALLMVGALLAAACSKGTANPNKSGSVQGASITIALGSEPSTLDVQLADDGDMRAVTENIVETLLGRTDDGKLYPLLASAMPTQKDATTWEVKLRPGIKFSDGEPFNADTVVSSVQRITNPKFNSDLIRFVETISGATAVNDTTVDITTKAPDPILPARLYVLPIVPPQAAAKSSFADHPIGTGPYELKEWAKGDHITIVPNPGYRGAKPSISTVTYKFIEDSGARLSCVLANECDLITNLTPEDSKQVPQFFNIASTEHPTMILDARSGIASNVQVRQALNYAVDKDAIATNLFGGFATVDNCQIISSSVAGYDPNLQPYQYDPAKAKQLLQAAGAAGQSINIVGESGRWLKDRETIEAVANYWRAVGLKVNIQILDFDHYLNQLFQQPNRPDAVFVSSDNELLDADLQMSSYYEDGGIGASNSDAQVKSIIDQARTETDTARRQALYAQALKIGCDQAYFLFLVNDQNLYGATQRLNFKPRTDGALIVSEWSVSS